VHILARRAVARPFVRVKPIKVYRIQYPVKLTSRRFYAEEKHVGGKEVFQKTTTGIPGYPVVPRSREVLMKLYERYLEEIKILPEGSPYREYMTKFAQHRLDICRSTEDIFEIEDRIGAGQMEELIEETELEFNCIYLMNEHRPWIPDSKWDTPFFLYSPVR